MEQPFHDHNLIYLTKRFKVYFAPNSIFQFDAFVFHKWFDKTQTRRKKISTNEMFLNLFATIDFMMWFWPLLRALDVVISRVRSSTGTKRNTTERKATDLLNRAELSNAKHCFDRVVKSRSQQTVSNYINLNDVENNINGTTKKIIYTYMKCSARGKKSE